MRLQCRELWAIELVSKGKPRDRAAADAEVIDALNEVLDSRVRAQWGFWKIDGWLDQKQRGINHKRLWRVYKSMWLAH